MDEFVQARTRFLTLVSKDMVASGTTGQVIITRPRSRTWYGRMRTPTKHEERRMWFDNIFSGISDRGEILTGIGGKFFVIDPTEIPPFSLQSAVTLMKRLIARAERTQ